jgi:deoxyribonuclease-4
MIDKSFRFGTVSSPTSTPPKPGGSQGGVLQIAALGLSALELAWVNHVSVTEATCEVIRQTALENDVALSVHASYFINANAVAEEWPKHRKRLMDAAHYGHLAGATDIIFHPGSYFTKLPAEVLPTVIDRLQNVVDELRSSGNPVTLRPETMGKSAMIGSLADVLKISQSIPGVVPCLDFAHLHARPGDGSVNTYPEWLNIIDEYAAALGQDALSHLHIHLSGIEYSAKGERKHLKMKESDLNITSLFQALHDRHCSGRILCESPILEEDALYMKKLWEDGNPVINQ